MAEKKPTDFVTPTGRIVWGNLYTPKTKDFSGQPLTVKTGDNKGKPTQRYEFGLAFPKRPGETHWAQSVLGAIIYAQGHRDHPEAAKYDGFAWKVVDGDSPKPGKPREGSNVPSPAPNTKAGFPGNWIFTFSSMRAPRIVTANGLQDILEKDAVRPGDYVQVAGTTVGNDGATPGVYINHEVVAFQGYHPEGRIVTDQGPDPATLGFGQGPQPVMVSAPVGGLAVGATAPLPAAQPTASPPPPAPLPQTAVQPHATILLPVIPGAAPPPPAAAAPPPPPPAAVGPQMTAAAQYTYAQYIASGWNDAALRAGGYMV